MGLNFPIKRKERQKKTIVKQSKKVKKILEKNGKSILTTGTKMSEL